MMGVFVMLFEPQAVSSKARRLISLLLIATVFTVVVWEVPTIRRRFEKVNSSNIRQQEGRVRMMPILWEIFTRSPIYGSGPDQYQVELTRKAMPYLIREHRTISSHNLLLLLLAETGIIGLLVFGIGVWKAFIAAWRARNSPEGLLPLALVCPYIISAILFANPLGTEVFWFVLAYGMAGAGLFAGSNFSFKRYGHGL
jgi:O-antigen ligase